MDNIYVMSHRGFVSRHHIAHLREGNWNLERLSNFFQIKQVAESEITPQAVLLTEAVPFPSYQTASFAAGMVQVLHHEGLLRKMDVFSC